MRKYLKHMRKVRYWSQEQTAKRIGIAQNYYSSIENGTRQSDMSYSMMEKLATAFEVPIQTIIDAEAAYRAEAKDSA